jgi:hypothetical protein
LSALEKDLEQPSKLEALTIWGRAKAILLGRSRSRNLLVLGVFLVVMGGATDVLSKTSGLPTETGSTLRILGVIAFVWGGMAYIRGE